MEVTALRKPLPPGVSLETGASLAIQASGNKLTNFTTPDNGTSIPDLTPKDHEVEWRQIQEEEEEHLEKYAQKERARTLGSTPTAPPMKLSESTEIQHTHIEEQQTTSVPIEEQQRMQTKGQQAITATPAEKQRITAEQQRMLKEEQQTNTVTTVEQQQTLVVTSMEDQQTISAEGQQTMSETPTEERQSMHMEAGTAQMDQTIPPTVPTTPQPKGITDDSSEHIKPSPLVLDGDRPAGVLGEDTEMIVTQLQTPVTDQTSSTTSREMANSVPLSQVVPAHATTVSMETGRHESQEGTLNAQQVDDDEETDDAPHQPVERSEVISQAVDAVPPPISMSPLAPPTITPKSQHTGHQRQSPTMNPAQHQPRIAPIPTHRLSYNPMGADPFGSLLPTADENEEEELKNLELTLQIVMSENKRLEDIVNRLRSRLNRARLSYPQGLPQAPHDSYGGNNSNPYLSHQQKQNPRSHPSVTEQARLLERGKLTTKNALRPLPGSIAAMKEARKLKLTGKRNPEMEQWLHNNQPQGKKYRHRPSPNLVNEVQKEVKKKQASRGKNKVSSNTKKTKPVKKATRRSPGAKMSTKKKATKAKKGGKSAHELKVKAGTKSKTGSHRVQDTKRGPNGKPTGRSKMNKNKTEGSSSGKKTTKLHKRAEEDISLAEIVRRRSSVRSRKKSASASPRKKSASASPRKKSASSSPRKKSASSSPRKKSVSASPRKKSASACPRKKSASSSPRRSTVGKPSPVMTELEADAGQTKASKMVQELARRVVEAKKKEAERMKMHHQME